MPPESHSLASPHTSVRLDEDRGVVTLTVTQPLTLRTASALVADFRRVLTRHEGTKVELQLGGFNHGAAGISLLIQCDFTAELLGSPVVAHGVHAALRLLFDSCREMRDVTSV